MSTKAKKCICKYGGFDNYVLLTKSEYINLKKRFQTRDSIFQTKDLCLKFNIVNAQTFRKLDSLMGEYLKALMLQKLSNPAFRVPYIPKGRPIKEKSMGLKPHIRQKQALWKPQELRNKDLSLMRVKLPEEMSRKEFEEWRTLVQMGKDNIDLNTDHPLIKVSFYSNLYLRKSRKSTKETSKFWKRT